jgi:hypothetical protein
VVGTEVRGGGGERAIGTEVRGGGGGGGGVVVVEEGTDRGGGHRRKRVFDEQRYDKQRGNSKFPPIKWVF